MKNPNEIKNWFLAIFYLPACYDSKKICQARALETLPFLLWTRAGGPSFWGPGARARARALSTKRAKSKAIKGVYRVLENFKGESSFDFGESFSVFHSLQHAAFEKIVAAHLAENKRKSPQNTSFYQFPPFDLDRLNSSCFGSSVALKRADPIVDMLAFKPWILRKFLKKSRFESQHVYYGLRSF